MISNEETITLKRKDFFRILRTIAIDRTNIAHLFNQVYGIARPNFDNILREVAKDFGVPYEELENVDFERFKHE